MKDSHELTFTSAGIALQYEHDLNESLAPNDLINASTLQADANSGEKMRKKRNKKKRRYETAPSEHIPGGSPIPTNDLNAEANMPVDSAHLIVAEYQGNHAHFDTLGHSDIEQRSNTAPREEIEHKHQAHVSSLHSQLQEDLQAATTHPSSLEPGRSSRTLVHPPSEEISREPPASVRSSPTASRRQRSDTDDHNNISHMNDRVSDQLVPARVSKRKQKRSRRVTAPAPSEHEHVSELSSDVIDYVQILAFKIRQHEQSASAKFSAEREALHVELQQAADAKQTLQDELDHVQQQKDILTTTIDQHKAKITAYESKVTRFKTFVDGLGKDIDSLKKEANTTRRQNEQLTQEDESRKAERKALQDQFNICAERSAQLNDKTLKACQETQAALQVAVIRSDYLEQQLSEKVGLLAEERDRRSQLERQLASGAGSDESVRETLQTNNDAVLEKLEEIHEELKERHNDHETSDMLQATFAGVEALNSETMTTMEGVASIKELINGLNEGYVLNILVMALITDNCAVGPSTCTIIALLGMVKKMLWLVSRHSLMKL